MTEIDWTASAGKSVQTLCSRRSRQPEAVRETIGDRVRGHQLILEDIGLARRAQNLRRIVIVACGTLPRRRRRPLHPRGMGASAGRADIASERITEIGADQGHARDRHPQSGETRDTVNAMKLAREHGCRSR
jgi:glucosamine 6-phosphate synthetase-like amidotransferase/phosphosugar isomerase protein